MCLLAASAPLYTLDQNANQQSNMWEMIFGMNGLAWGGNAHAGGSSILGKKIHGTYPNLAVNPDIGAEINPLDTAAFV